MSIYWFQIALGLICAFALIQSNSAIKRVAFVLLGNAIACIAWKLWTGQENALFNILIDGLSAWLVMRAPAGKMQGAIALTFASQIGSHIAYAQYPFGEAIYWQTINAIFVCQLLLLAFWSEWHGGQIRRISSRLFSRVVGGKPSRGVAKP